MYFGSSSTLIARASSFGDNLASAGAVVVVGIASGGTSRGAKSDESGGTGIASAFLTSTLSAWKLYRSLEGSFGAEVFKPPNTDLVTVGGDSVVGNETDLPLIWVLSVGSIISAGCTTALKGLASSTSWVRGDRLVGGVLRRFEGLSSSSRTVIVSATSGVERVVSEKPLGAEAKGSLSKPSST